MFPLFSLWAIPALCQSSSQGRQSRKHRQFGRLSPLSFLARSEARKRAITRICDPASEIKKKARFTVQTQRYGLFRKMENLYLSFSFLPGRKEHKTWKNKVFSTFLVGTTKPQAWANIPSFPSPPLFVLRGKRPKAWW